MLQLLRIVAVCDTLQYIDHCIAHRHFLKCLVGVLQWQCKYAAIRCVVISKSPHTGQRARFAVAGCYAKTKIGFKVG